MKDETETPSAPVGTAANDNSESNLPAQDIKGDFVHCYFSKSASGNSCCKWMRLESCQTLSSHSDKIMLIRSAASEGPGGFKPAELVGPSAAAAAAAATWEFSVQTVKPDLGLAPSTPRNRQEILEVMGVKKKKKSFLTLRDCNSPVLEKENSRSLFVSSLFLRSV